LPSNPFLGLSKAGYPVSLCCLGASDPASVAKQLTADDLVWARQLRRRSSLRSAEYAPARLPTLSFAPSSTAR
jgi:hypothetical protein